MFNESHKSVLYDLIQTVNYIIDSLSVSLTIAYIIRFLRKKKEYGEIILKRLINVKSRRDIPSSGHYRPINDFTALKKVC